MQMSFLSLFKDSQNFIYNRLVYIVSTLLLLAIITETILFFFLPSIDTLVPLKQIIENSMASYSSYSMPSIRDALEKMPTDQRQQLVSVLFSYVSKYLLISIINNLTTISVSLALIWQLASSQQFNGKQVLHKALSLIPSIALFMLLSVPYFLTLVFLSALITSLMPLVLIIGFLLHSMVYRLFLAYIVNSNTTAIFQNILATIKILCQQLQRILPLVSVWFFVTLVVGYLTSLIHLNHFIINVLITFVNLFIYFFIFTYFYRLCSLSK